MASGSRSLTYACVLSIIVVPLCTYAAEEPKEVYFRGVNLYDAGKVDEARALWSNLLETRRTDLTARQVEALEGRLALSSRATAPQPERGPAGSDEEVSALEAALRSNPGDRDLQYRYCQSLLKRGRPEDTVRAEEVSSLFLDSERRNELDNLAAEIAVRKARQAKRAASEENALPPSGRKGARAPAGYCTNPSMCGEDGIPAGRGTPTQSRSRRHFGGAASSSCASKQKASSGIRKSRYGCMKGSARIQTIRRVRSRSRRG